LAIDEEKIMHIHHISQEAQSLKNNKKIQMWKSLCFHENGDNEGTSLAKGSITPHKAKG
jgi:hypothetical protein